MRRLLGVVATAAVTVGPACTVGPDYTRPVVTTPDVWYQNHVQGVEEGEARVQTWRTVFDDPFLAELIEEAQGNNRDIQVAFFPIVEARADQAFFQQQLADSKGTRVQSLVGLYRALGGGWDIENADVTPPPAGLEEDAEAGKLYTIVPPSSDS